MNRGLPPLPPYAGNRPELGSLRGTLVNADNRLAASDRSIVHGKQNGVGGLRSTHGPLLGQVAVPATWGAEAGGLGGFRETGLNTVAGPSDAPSFLPLSTGKLNAGKPVFKAGGGTTQRVEHATRSQPAGGHYEQPTHAKRCRGRSQKRRLLAFSNPEHRWAGGETQGGVMSFGGGNTFDAVCCCSFEIHCLQHQWAEWRARCWKGVMVRPRDCFDTLLDRYQSNLRDMFTFRSFGHFLCRCYTGV